jgi:hypothetical protein
LNNCVFYHHHYEFRHHTIYADRFVRSEGLQSHTFADRRLARTLVRIASELVDVLRLELVEHGMLVERHVVSVSARGGLSGLRWARLAWRWWRIGVAGFWIPDGLSFLFVL